MVRKEVMTEVRRLATRINDKVGFQYLYVSTRDDMVVVDNSDPPMVMTPADALEFLRHTDRNLKKILRRPVPA